MFNRHYRKVRILFGLTDVAVIAVAFIAAYQTRVLLHFERVFYLDFPIAALLLLLSALCWVAIGYWFNIYEKLDSAHLPVILRDTFQQCLVGTVCLVLAQYFIRLDLSRPFVAIFGVYSWILLCLFRINAGSWIGAVRRRFGTAHFIMVVGTGENAHKLGRALEQSAHYGVRLLGFLGEHSGCITLSKDYPIHPMAELPRLLRQHVIDEVIFAVDSRTLPDLEDVFLMCDEEGVRTRVIVDFFPHVNSELSLDRLGSTPLLTFSAAPHDELRMVLAMIIRLTSPGPAIFRQERCGLNGRRFVFYKFRSMCDNAEQLKAQFQHLNRKTTAFKIPNDPRLTGLGRILRKFSVDEWPQLWNVVKGDMSLVGPRPAVPEEVENYQRWQRRRLRMRPGLTCLWAIAGRDTLDFDTWMKMDMQYIDNWSLTLDWKIMLRTIPRVLTGKGAS